MRIVKMDPVRWTPKIINPIVAGRRRGGGFGIGWLGFLFIIKREK